MRFQRLLSRQQVEDIHRNALRVLEEVGVKVEHPETQKRLASIGGQVNTATDVVIFPAKTVEAIISDAPKMPPHEGPPSISLWTTVYQCQYLDPVSDQLRAFDDDTLARWFAFAKSLPAIGGAGIMGVPFVPSGVSAKRLALAEKLYAWRNGVFATGSVHFTELCEPLMEMFRIHASALGKKPEEVFCADGYLISPLRMTREVCEQLHFFEAHGLRMRIGHLPSEGGSAPVTLAGTVVLVHAERLFLFLLYRAMWGDTVFRIAGQAGTLDMRSAHTCFGRPERLRIQLAMADLADYYGCACSGCASITDAQAPSFEAGVQKAQSAVLNVLTIGGAYIEAGLLGVDEICSPVQMVLDHDLAMGLRALFADAAVDDVERAFEEIKAAGHTGNHLGTDYTAQKFRTVLFEPMTWSNSLVAAALLSGIKLDVDRARDVVSDFQSRYVPQSYISEDEERELWAVIRS